MTNLKIVLFTFLLFFWGSTSFTQSFYEIKFSDTDGNEYTGFWVYSSESENYMRMAYFNELDEYRVVNIDCFAETGDTGDGVYYFALMGENPVWITEHNDGEAYNPDYFIWIRFEGEEYGMPLVTDDPEFAEDSFVEVTSYIELDPMLFNEEYLNQFYSTDEEDYIALMNMVDQNNAYLVAGYDTSIGDNTTSTDNTTIADNTTNNNDNNTENGNNNNAENNEPVTMHLVVAANTDIGDIGVSCDVDKKNLVSEFEGICEVMNITLEQYILDGKEFTKENLISTLNGLNPGKNDIVMFVYTGHGFRWSDQTEKYPQLDLRYNPYTQITSETSMTLKEVSDIITAKDARLNIIFGDCCNSDVGVNQRTTNSFLASRNDANYNRQNLDKLFFDSKGDILATAASPGQVSWSNSVNGGFFLSSFFQAFREEIGYLDTDPNWNDMIQNTIKYASYKTSKAACSNCTEQNGQKSISVTY